MALPGHASWRRRCRYNWACRRSPRRFAPARRSNRRTRSSASRAKRCRRRRSRCVSFIDKGLRHGRPLGGYVTYNTWYCLRHVPRRSSRCWPRWTWRPRSASSSSSSTPAGGRAIDPDDPGDFVDGWGNWQVDPIAFPNGLGALSDRAHSARHAIRRLGGARARRSATVGQPGLAQERFLATTGSALRPGRDERARRSPRRCALVDAAARELGARQARRLHRRGAPGLPEVGQQLLGQLHCVRATATAARTAISCTSAGVRTVLDALRETLSGPRHRELRERGQPPVARHAGRDRRGVDGRSHVSVRANAARTGGARPALSAGATSCRSRWPPPTSR